MKKTLIILTITLAATNAFAISKYDANSMSCSSVHQKIVEDGEVVLRFPSNTPGLTIYNRYVSNSTMCVGQGTATAANVTTSDSATCEVVTCATTKSSNRNHN